jgi:endonuclease YncB( thermonuclease family)
MSLSSIILGISLLLAGSGAAMSQPVVQRGAGTFTCTPTRVWDGDGPIWCAEGPRIRLAGIAAREMDGSCSPGHPCPSADPTSSRNHLARLIGRVTGQSREGHLLVSGPALRCQPEGSAGGNRTAAWCTTHAGVNLSCQMVRDGMAARWDRYWRGQRC